MKKDKFFFNFVKFFSLILIVIGIIFVLVDLMFVIKIFLYKEKFVDYFINTFLNIPTPFLLVVFLLIAFYLIVGGINLLRFKKWAVFFVCLPIIFLFLFEILKILFSYESFLDWNFLRIFLGVSSVYIFRNRIKINF